MSYRFSFSTRDTKFIMKEWLPVEEILAYPKYSDYYSLDDFDTIIDQVRKISEDIIAPTAEDADAIGAQWRDGQVYIPESFHKAIRFMHDNGWATSNYDEEGEGVLPMVLFHALAEIMAAANPALFAYTATGSGVVAVMNHYASDEV
ncbi:MAG TPA: acyl-CoA dehydrogenase N-terminal domain-containing protein, partial [Syntrophomonas sp.]|nr:acyl-CoA dehydrogenase N-terminal domain-containing protein [Syntrophomonas sp.]